MGRTVSLVVALAVAAGAGGADDFKREGTPAQRVEKDAMEGKAPPALEVKGWLNTGGKPVKFEELRGKVVVLDFWGVWCGPCRKAVPHLKELYEKHKDDGLVVIGVHTTAQGEKMADFVKKE